MIERYQTDDMKNIWSDQNKYDTWLDVELAAVEVLVDDESPVEFNQEIFSIRPN